MSLTLRTAHLKKQHLHRIGGGRAMTDRETALLNSLKTANDLLGECDQYISAEPSRLFKWFCIGLFVGFLIGRFV
jgi:hypothetical protein